MLTKLMIFFLFYSISCIGWAKVTCSYPENVCGVTEPEIQTQVSSLIDRVQQNDKNLNSVDSFIAGLPEEMRKNFILMGPSRSNQDGSNTNPKAILKSPNSEVIASFNSHSSQNGFNEVELMTWNAQEQKYDMFSITFEKDSKVLGKNRPTKVSKNPATCIGCHGNPPHPRWDHPPMWSGQIPFTTDTLVDDRSIDKLNYLRTIQGIENAKNKKKDLTPYDERMRHLIPPLSSTEIQAAPFIEIPSDGTLSCKNSGFYTKGPGFKMYDQLSVKNFCQISNEVEKSPGWDNAKYAAYGVLKGCSLEEMTRGRTVLPNAKKYYERLGYKINTDLENEYANLQKTLNVQLLTERARIKKDRENRQKLIFGDLTRSMAKDSKIVHLDSEVQFEKWTKVKSGSLVRMDIDEGNETKVNDMRMLLEPMGIDMKKWSISLDPTGYNFGDMFNELLRSPAFQEVASELGDKADDCAVIADKSRNALKEKNYDDIVEKNIVSCAPTQLDLSFTPVAMVDELNKGILRTEAQKIVNQACTQCHTSVDKGGFAQEMGAPVINLLDLNEFEKDLDNNFFQGQMMVDSMVSRVSRDPNAVGSMPPVPPMSPMSQDQRQLLINYVEQFRFR